MQIEYERGISNPGNQYRMKKLMARAEAGETLSIGFLGGSITQGCLASAPELCYAYRVFQWWRKHFHRPNFIISMPESVEQHHISGRLVPSPICFPINRILLSLNFRSMMNQRNFSVRHMKDWYAVYGRMKTNLL